ncbi:MAG: CoB--CoM heterodisulfide reductase iron-sulfur subunit B family protein [Dehalococcoidales bacterium]|nr:CoB--CoM heterodisulfide reductase iron-sulfur subunit B family protein [Dehalococcoidales bacterium]
MKISYYPGCSLDGTAVDYSESLQAVARILDIKLEELPDWTCCGSSSAHVMDDRLAVSLAGRNLIIADKIGQDLMVPCAACFQRLKAADKHIKAGQTVEGMQHKYEGKFKIKHSADLIWEDCGEKTIAAKVKRPLAGLNPVCYYGCLTTRPPRITDAASSEDPQSMDEIMKVLGAEVKNWSYKTDCCGGNLVLTHTELAKKLIKKILDMAEEAGADCIVAGCPMCQSNLDTRQNEILKENGQRYNLPVYYFTELMALAYDDLSVEKCLNKHITDAVSLLRKKGLL